MGRGSGGEPRSSKHEMMPKGGNFTAVVEFGGTIGRATVAGNDDFILRRIQSDERSSLDLGKCIQPGPGEDKHEYELHLTLPSNEGKQIESVSCPVWSITEQSSW